MSETEIAGQWRYYASEGAVLRTTDPGSASNLEVYHPGKGWVSYDDYEDFMYRAREVTAETAEKMIERDEAARREL